MNYKVGRNEKIVTELSIDSKTLFIITRSKDDVTYNIYGIDKDGNTNKLYKGDNPQILEDKVGYTKMCDKWRNSNG